MKILLPFLILFLIIIESALFSFPFAAIIVLLTASFWEEKSELLAFLSGIVLDFFTLRTIGTTSLFFLFFVFIWKGYLQKVYQGRMWFRVILLSVATVSYTILFYRYVSWISFLGTIFLAFVFLTFVNRFFTTVWEKDKLSYRRK